ncbi:MAG: hypothetical protein AAGC74_02550 [Verrucomicrobiota bacterium]
MKLFSQTTLTAFALSTLGNTLTSEIITFTHTPPPQLTTTFFDQGLIISASTPNHEIIDIETSLANNSFNSDYLGFAGNEGFEPTSITIIPETAPFFSLQSIELGLGPFTFASTTDITLTAETTEGSTLSTSYPNLHNPTLRILNWSDLTSLVITATSAAGIDNIAFTLPVVATEKFEIIASGFEGANFFIELDKPAFDKQVLYSSTLDFADPSVLEADVDSENPNRFILTPTQFNPTRSFFRVDQ